MITDTLELDDDEIEEEAQGEVDKVLHELTDGTCFSTSSELAHPYFLN